MDERITATHAVWAAALAHLPATPPDPDLLVATLAGHPALRDAALLAILEHLHPGDPDPAPIPQRAGDVLRNLFHHPTPPDITRIPAVLRLLDDLNAPPRAASAALATAAAFVRWWAGDPIGAHYELDRALGHDPAYQLALLAGEAMATTRPSSDLPAAELA